jgi:hypothetical protein
MKGPSHREFIHGDMARIGFLQRIMILLGTGRNTLREPEPFAMVERLIRRILQARQEPTQSAASFRLPHFIFRAYANCYTWGIIRILQKTSFPAGFA